MLPSILCGRKRACLRLCGVSVPQNLETLHWLSVGSTGTGKTSLQSLVMAQVIARGDRVIVVDPNGHSLSQWLRVNDIVLNPFDARDPGWSVFNEARASFDYLKLARSVIPDGHGSERAWNGYAQNLLSQTMQALALRGEMTTERLLHWLTIAPTSELKDLLAGTSASGLFDPEAGRALASTKFVVSHFLASHEFLKPSEFSLVNWLHLSAENLYISWREDMSNTLRPLISCWIDVICNAVLSLPAESDRRIWIFLDELGALGPISSLEGALTRGRKHGLCLWAGLQSTAQLELIYGREKATVLLSCFRNLTVLAIAKSDPETAEKMSKSLGDREVDRTQYARNSGPSGISKGVSSHRVSERLVLPSEITSLPNLQAYLALAGDEPICQIRIQPQTLPVVATAIQEAE